MPIVEIHDQNDSRLDDFREIKERDLHGRQGIFIGEQPLIVEQMLARPTLLRRILVIERRRSWLEKALKDHGNPDIECLIVGRDLLEEIAGFDVHRGVLASGNRSTIDQRTLNEIIPHSASPATILCCESINNLDNIGMLFRTAAAFAVDAVLLSPDCHDPLYRKSLRVSIGHALSVPFYRATDWEKDLHILREDHGFTLAGASIGENSIPHLSMPISSPARIGVVMGSEFEGLSAESISACEYLIRIPMAEEVDSLNVCVAAAVLLDRLSQGARA